MELNTELETSDADQLIEQYLKRKLNISVDGTLQNYTWVGKEYNKDMVHIYLEMTNIDIPKTIEVKNTVLMDTYPEQENIIRIRIKEEVKSLFLTKNHDTGKVIF